MYWFRHGSLINFLPWVITASIWMVGGWLIATHAFNLGKKERLVIGIGLGLICYLWLINLIGRWLLPDLAYLLPTFIVLIAGLLFAWRSGKPLLDLNDFSIYPVLIGLLLLFGFSVLLERGLAIFDDYHHLPAISVMGAGSLPPRYFLNANFNFTYHYGFQLLGASLMRIGDLFAWSAYDVSKALVWAYSIILFGFVLHHYLQKNWHVLLACAALILMGGTRYLLMLFPQEILKGFDSNLGFAGVSQNMGVPFSQALFSSWIIGGGPPQPYIFGFINGIYGPHIMSHAGEWPTTLIIILLIWLLADKISSWKAVPVITILMAHLALTFESSYGLMIAAILLIALFIKIKKPEIQMRAFWYFVLGAVLSIPFSFLQGGTLFSIIQNVLLKANANQPAVIIHSAAESVFSLHTPTIFSAHFGDLNIFSPYQLIVALFEIGPILFFTPWITSWAIRKFRHGDWMPGIIIISTWLGFILSLFVSYNLSERDITRFTKHAIIFWMMIFLILIFSNGSELKKWGKYVAITCLIIMSVGGVVDGVTQSSALVSPVISDGIDGLDAKLSSELWGKLPQNDWIFDPSSREWRATALTGVFTVAGQYRDNTSEWTALSRNPSLQRFIKNNYRFLYVDENWWQNLTDDQRKSMADPCIKTIVSVVQTEDYKFRRLLDLEQCQQ